MYRTREQKRQKYLELMREAKKKKGLTMSQSQLSDYIKKAIENRPKLIAQLKDYYMLKTDKFPDIV